MYMNNVPVQKSLIELEKLAVYVMLCYSFIIVLLLSVNKLYMFVTN